MNTKNKEDQFLNMFKAMKASKKINYKNTKAADFAYKLLILT
jgi:hypothetical protein